MKDEEQLLSPEEKRRWYHHKEFIFMYILFLPISIMIGIWYVFNNYVAPEILYTPEEKAFYQKYNEALEKIKKLQDNELLKDFEREYGPIYDKIKSKHDITITPIKKLFPLSMEKLKSRDSLLIISIIVLFFITYKLFKKKIIKKYDEFFLQVAKLEKPLKFGNYKNLEPNFPIKLNLFDGREIQITKEDFLSIFKENKEDSYKKFFGLMDINIITDEKVLKKDQIKQIEEEGGVRITLDFNELRKDIVEYVNKLTNFAIKNGYIDFGDEKRIKHFAISFYIIILHKILYNYGNTPTGLLSVYVKDNVFKKVFSVYQKEKVFNTQLDAAEDTKIASDYLTAYIYFTKSDFIEKKIRNKYRTLPEEE